MQMTIIGQTSPNTTAGLLSDRRVPGVAERMVHGVAATRQDRL